MATKGPATKHAPGHKIVSPKDTESTDGVQRPVSDTLPPGAAKTGVKKE